MRTLQPFVLIAGVRRSGRRLSNASRRRSPAPSASSANSMMLVSEEEVEKGAQVAYRQELEKARKQGRSTRRQEMHTARAERSRNG